jgi:hypothetical protein
MPTRETFLISLKDKKTSKSLTALFVQLKEIRYLSDWALAEQRIGRLTPTPLGRPPETSGQTPADLRLVRVGIIVGFPASQSIPNGNEVWIMNNFIKLK